MSPATKEAIRLYALELKRVGYAKGDAYAQAERAIKTARRYQARMLRRDRKAGR